MFFAKYKKQLGEWFFMWSLWITITGIDWAGKGRSPLVWPNLWGVIEWLSWTAIAFGIVELGGGQLRRELPGRRRSQDIFLLLCSFGRWLLFNALLVGMAAGRFYYYVYVLGLRSDLRLPIDKLKPADEVKLGIVIVTAYAPLGLLIFACRMIAVLMRKYDQA